MFSSRLPRFKGFRPLARTQNAMVDALAQAGRLSVSGFSCYRGPIGTLLWDDRPRLVKAILTGTSGGGYSWEHAAKADGGAYSGFVAGAGVAYEANGATGLVGQVVTLWPSEAADWRFQFVRSGNPKWTFKVKNGCDGSLLAGAVVTLQQGGVTIATCTTGDGTGLTALGQCTLSVPSGTYDVTIAHEGYTTYSDTLTLSGSLLTTVTLAIATGAICVSGCCSGTSIALPSELVITDDNGTWTASYDSTVAGWVAICSFMSGLVLTCDGSTPPDGYPCFCWGYSYTSASVAYVYVVKPDVSGSCLSLTAYYPLANCVNPGPDPCASIQFHGYLPGTSAGTGVCPAGEGSALCDTFGDTWLYAPSNRCNGGGQFGSAAATAETPTCDPFSMAFSFPSGEPAPPSTSATISL
jgi:hypothetical protein